MKDKDKAITCAVGCLLNAIALWAISTGHNMDLGWIIVVPFLLFAVFGLFVMSAYYFGRASK